MGRAKGTPSSTPTGAHAFNALLGARRGPPPDSALHLAPGQLSESQAAQLAADPEQALRYLRRHAGQNAKACRPLARAVLTPYATETAALKVPQLRALQHALRIEEPTSNLLAVYAPAGQAPVLHARRQTDGSLPASFVGSLSTVCGLPWAASNDWQLPLLGRVRSMHPGLQICARCDADAAVTAEARRRPTARAARCVAQRTLDESVTELTVSPPGTLEELPGLTERNWRYAAARTLAGHLRLRPDSVRRALAEENVTLMLPDLAAKQLRALSEDWWSDLVSEHMDRYHDYVISENPQEAMSSLGAPWGRQSRRDWRGRLRRALEENNVGLVRHVVSYDYEF